LKAVEFGYLVVGPRILRDRNLTGFALVVERQVGEFPAGTSYADITLGCIGVLFYGTMRIGLHEWLSSRRKNYP
jgi:hypothetical protein